MSAKTQQLQVPAEDSMPAWRELTSEEWARIEPLIPVPQERPSGRKRQISDRQIVDAILYIHHTKTDWKDLPEQFGPWTGVAKRISRWRETGTYQQVYDELEVMGLIVNQTTIVQPPIQEEVEKPLEWWELTNEEWEAVAHFFPPDLQKASSSKRFKTNREMLNALLYREYTKTAWRNMPEQFGHWRTVNDHFTKWRDDGILQQVFSKLDELGALSKSEDSKVEEEESGDEGPRDWWELTNEQWKRIAPLISQENYRNGGKRPRTNRQMLNAILCRQKTFTPWRELPEKYGHWRTVNDRFTKWKNDGTLQRVFEELSKISGI